MQSPARPSANRSVTEIALNSAQFSPDGSRIVTAGDDNCARVWSAATGQPVGQPLLLHQEAVMNAQFSPDGTHIITASWDGTARVRDVAAGHPFYANCSTIREFRVGRALQPGWHGSWSAAIGDCTARIWDADTGQPIGEPLRHKGSVLSAQFSSDGTRIVTASEEP